MKYVNNNKLNEIKLTKSNFYVAVDFDRTITARKSCGSWDVCRDVLGEGFIKENTELYNKYAPIELDYTISFDEKYKAMEEWYYKNLKLYYDYNLTAKQMEEAVRNSCLIFRTGAKDFLHDMYIKKIPVVILSAGIGNVIEQFLKKNDCYYSNIHIISNFIPFDKNGNIEEFKGDLIHTLNKTTEGRIEGKLAQDINGRAYRLLVGDFIEDKKMVPAEEWDKTISIGILNEKVEDNLEVYKKNFDSVLTNEDASFGTIKKLIEI